jgi:SAM-dependent methyltransferase
LKFKDSTLAHKFLDNLWGIEIGRAEHNPFNLPHCLNIDFSGDMDTPFKKAEIRNCGKAAEVDIVAQGDDLPFKDKTLDYVISSHVIEHFFDPIKTLQEWMRVIKPNGYIFIICPHASRVPDEKRPITTLQECIDRHEGRIRPEDIIMAEGHEDHRSVWDTEAFLELCKYLNLNIVEYLDVDDKVGNGFCVVIQK